MLKNYISLLILGCIVCHGATLKIIPPVAINAFHREQQEYLFCQTNGNPGSIEWLSPSLRLISSEYSGFGLYKIDFTKSISPGSYWCRNQSNHSITAESKVILTDNLTLIEKDVILIRDHKHNVVINCSTIMLMHQSSNLAWARVLYDPIFVITENFTNYTMSSLDLTLHNVTGDDMGIYACYANNTNRVIKVISVVAIEWPPELPSEQIKMITVNATENVILNCTTSASPDPVYSWSFPDFCSSCPNTSNDSALIFIAKDTDSGEYTCIAENSHGSLSISFIVVVIPYVTLLFNNDTYLFQQQITLPQSDVFLKCIINYGMELSMWTLDGELVWINETTKYNVNTSGLTIYNVTAEDEGNYACHVHHLTSNIFLHVVWAPKLLFEQNQTVWINISEQIILNCTVSSSPDPVYSWYIPNSCSSCPRNANNNILSFTTNFTDLGSHLFRCNATNSYGSITISYTVHVLSKPVMFYSAKTIVKDRSNINIILTCAVKYSHPTAKITWNIMTDSSTAYGAVNQNSTGNYILHNNGSLEVYHRYVYEEDHITAMCLAVNKYGYAQTVFQLWDPEKFYEVKTFVLYVKTCSCQELKYKADSLFTELRKWFSSVCKCDGLNNLHDPQLNCMGSTTANVTSKVYHNSNNAAQTLIHLARNNIQSKNPPSIQLPSGWMVCLNPYCGWECDNGISGSGGYYWSYSFQESVVLYVKNLTNCQNHNANVIDSIQSSLQEWLRSLCDCKLKLITFQHTCYDEFTMMIKLTIAIQYQNNISIDDMIVKQANKSGSNIFLVHSGLVVCRNPDCHYNLKFNNKTTVINDTKKSDDRKSLQLIIGPIIGALCGITILLMIFIFVMYKRKLKQSKCSVPKFPNSEDIDHIYDELNTYTMKHMGPSFINKTPSPKGDKVIFDTKASEPPDYQSLPAPRYESCSSNSIAKSNLSNNYCIEEDARSINDGDCNFALEKSSNHQKENEPYCKLYHLK